MWCLNYTVYLCWNSHYWRKEEKHRYKQMIPNVWTVVYIGVLETVPVLCIRHNCLPGCDLCGGCALGGGHRCICSLDLSCVVHGRLRQVFLWDYCCSFRLHHGCHSGSIIYLHYRSCCGARSYCLCRSEIRPWRVKTTPKDWENTTM